MKDTNVRSPKSGVVLILLKSTLEATPGPNGFNSFVGRMNPSEGLARDRGAWLPTTHVSLVGIPRNVSIFQHPVLMFMVLPSHRMGMLTC